MIINKKINAHSEAKKDKVPDPPKRVKLTNKAGAGASPLAKDVDAWLQIGWFRA